MFSARTNAKGKSTVLERDGKRKDRRESIRNGLTQWEIYHREQQYQVVFVIPGSADPMPLPGKAQNPNTAYCHRYRILNCAQDRFFRQQDRVRDIADRNNTPVPSGRRRRHPHRPSQEKRRTQIQLTVIDTEF